MVSLGDCVKYFHSSLMNIASQTLPDFSSSFVLDQKNSPHNYEYTILIIYTDILMALRDSDF